MVAIGLPNPVDSLLRPAFMVACGLNFGRCVEYLLRAGNWAAADSAIVI